MPDVLYLVNTVSSTSIPVEIGNAVNEWTDSTVTIGDLMETADATLDPDVRDMDFPLEFFGGSGNFDPRGYRHLWSHLREREYDLIHTHHNFSGAVGRAIGALLDIPVVNTEHNDLRHFSVAQRAVNTATFGFPCVNVYNSNATKASRGPIARKLSKRDEVIYNGIDVDRVESGREVPLPVDLPDGKLLTNVGVMTEQKNQEAILEAASEIQDRAEAEDVHFVIAGTGPLATELKSRATRLGVDEMVTFTGYLPRREQIYSLLHRSDAFLAPSKYEGFCVAAVEAMACELPVIASDIEVLREVVGEHGIFVPPGNSRELANRIVETVRALDADSMEKRRRGLYERAMAEYPLRRTAGMYHDLYEEVASP